MSYTLISECGSCGREQKITVDLREGYSDSDVREALDDSLSECDNCGDRDWNRLGDPKLIGETV